MSTVSHTTYKPTLSRELANIFYIDRFDQVGLHTRFLLLTYRILNMIRGFAAKASTEALKSLQSVSALEQFKAYQPLIEEDVTVTTNGGLAGDD